MKLNHKSYKSCARTVLLALSVSLLAAGLSSCSQSDESDFEPIAPPPLEIPPVDPPPVSESETDVTSPAPEVYSPLPTAPATSDAPSSPYGAFGVTPATPTPNSPNSTIPFSTGEPVIPPPSSSIQVTPQAPIMQPAPVAPTQAPAVPSAPSAVPNVAPSLPSAAPGVPNATGNPGMYVPPPASTF